MKHPNQTRWNALTASQLFKAGFCLLFLVGLSGALQAANVTTAAQQAAGANWNAPGIWSDGLAPSAGNTYQVIAGGGPSRVRNPVLGSGQVTTFAGDSLTIDAGQEIRWKGPGVPGTISAFPGVGGNPGLICNGCLLNVGDDMTATIQGKVQFTGNSILDDSSTAARSHIFQADVSGSGNITIQNALTTNPNDFQSSANTYNGTWTVNSGYLKGSGNNSLGTNSITMASGTILEVNYDLQCFGTITLNGTAQMKLHSFVQVQNAVVNGTPVPPGLYTWAQANAAFPANFPAGGSGGIRVGTPIDAIFQDAGAAYIAWEAENKVAITNSGSASWAVISDGAASGGSAITEQGSSDTANAASTARWNLVFRQAGTYHLYIKYLLSPCCGANSYKFPNRFGGDLTPTDASWKVSRANENGAGPTVYTVIHEREQNQTIVFATFTVAAGDVGNPLVLEFGNREAPGLTIDRIALSPDPTLADAGNGPFDALINSTGGSQLLPAPKVLSVDSRLNPNGLQVKFNGAVDATGLNPVNYTLDNGVTVSGAAYAVGNPNSNVVQLTTTALTPNTTYTVTVTGVQNLQALVQDPNPTNRTFTHYAGLNQPAGLTVKIFNGANTLPLIKTAVASCAVPTFTADTTNVAMEYTTSERSATVDGNTFLQPNTDNYGTWIYGLFVPPVSGNYQFALSSDDQSELYLSTDSNPANKVLLTSQAAWNGYRGYVSGNGNPAPGIPAPRPLIAGATYYLEVLVQEGGGGDHVSVAVRKPGDPAMADNQLPIPRSMFATNYSFGCPPTSFFQTLGPISITAQPVSQTVGELAPTTFFVGLDGIPDYFVQWYSNGVAIAGATKQAYTFNPLRFASGSQYYAIAQNDFSSVTSSVVTLTVIVDSTPPTLVSVVGGASRALASVVFSEPLATAGATTLGNYQITNAAGTSLAISGVVLSPDGKTVTLTTAPQTVGEQYFVVVGNVTDRAGVPNVLAPNPSVGSLTPFALDCITGKVLFRAYNAGGNSTAVDAMVNDASYPNSPDWTQLIGGMNSRLASDPANPTFYNTDARENYGATMVGQFIPPTSGTWILYTSADDGSRLYMNTNGPDASGKTQLLNVIPCCGAFAANPTIPLNLVAGQAYYLEALYKEGGGGDFMQVAARLQGDNSTLVPIPAANLAFCTQLTISQQPTNRTVVQNALTTFTVVASVAGAGVAPLYQWQRSEDASGLSFTNIPGATASSFTYNAPLADDLIQFRCELRLVLQTNLTSAATLHVVADNIPPYLVGIRSDETFTKIYLTWSELMTAGTATEPSSYVIQDPQMNQIFVDTVTYAGSNVVLNLVSPMLENTLYSVELDFQLDLVGNGPDPVGNPAIDTDHGVVATLHSWVSSPCGGVEFSLFNNLSTGDNNIRTSLMADPRFPNNPTSVSFIPGLSSRLLYPDDSHEGYGARLRGLFIPPTSGNWVFYIRSDDSSILYFNPSGPNAAGKVIIQEETGCCGAFSGHPSAPQALVAGQGYYIEMLYKEGTGGDYGLVGAKLQGQPAPTTDADTIPASQLGFPAAPPGAGGPVSITVQPGPVSVVENTPASFSVTANSPNDLPICYQWRRDGVDIPGANGRTFSIPAVVLGDNGAVFSVQVSIVGTKTISANALLSVSADTTAPLALVARGVRSMDAVKVTFNELMGATATDAINYTLTDTNGAPVEFAGPLTLGVDGKTVTIPTAVLNEGTVYHVGIAGVADLAGNLIAGTNLQFRTWLVGLGSLLFDVYSGLDSGQTLATFTNVPAFPNSPSLTRHIASADSRRVYPDNSHEGYGARMSGYVVPPLSGNYNFYISADDDAELSLSTDSSPTNSAVIVFAPSCCAAYSAHGISNIALAAGTDYYIQLLYKEGTGGDYGQVAAKLTADPTNPDGLPTIPGAYLASLADPMGASITITQQPLSINVAALATPALSVGLTSTNDYGDYDQVAYQWQQWNGSSFVNILQAGGATYTTTPVNAGESRRYRVIVYIPGANATSSEAVVQGPGQLTITGNGDSTATLRWVGPGILQESDAPNGPWTDRGNQANPQTVTTPPGTKFFQLR